MSITVTQPRSSPLLFVVGAIGHRKPLNRRHVWEGTSSRAVEARWRDQGCMELFWRGASWGQPELYGLV
ncbi:hypothetical protein HRI_000028100 [Hibiscus trionum]|uniref:Uncharacterized protein n=1 Tax=Hibiscus trionum TaxID=183268 RepID=A0A9W7LFY7_HIBTR|nr:hypothetical protein HRI_000028100 [Hibiscus trionum]